MDENIKDLLNEEIAAEIQAISSLDSGSNEKSKAIEDLAKLYRLRIEEKKVSWTQRISEADVHWKAKRVSGKMRLRNLSWMSRLKPMYRTSSISVHSLMNK